VYGIGKKTENIILLVSFCYSIVCYLTLYKVIKQNERYTKIYWINTIIGLTFLIVSMVYLNIRNIIETIVAPDRTEIVSRSTFGVENEVFESEGSETKFLNRKKDAYIVFYTSGIIYGVSHLINGYLIVSGNLISG